MPRLPIVASDGNAWGTVLNEYLTVAHNADGTLKPAAVSSPVGVQNVRAHGAVGDGVIDDTAAIQAAITAAGVGGVVYLPKTATHYKITASLDARNIDGLTIVGSTLYAVIWQYTANTPILRMGGNGQVVRNLGLFFQSVQPAANTRAVGLELNGNFFSVFDHITVYGAAYGVQCPMQAAWVGQPQNGFFSCSLSNIQVTRYTNVALDLHSFNGGYLTGSVLSNIYTQNNDANGRQTSNRALSISGCDEMVINQFNVEHSRFAQSPILINNATNVNIGALHVEGAEMTAWGESLLVVYGNSSAKVGVMTVDYCFFLATNAARFGFIYGGAGGSLLVDLLKHNNNTITSTEVYLIRSTDASTGKIEIMDYRTYNGDVLAGEQDVNALTIPYVRRVGDNVYAYRLNGKWVLTGTAAPTAGTWAVGDRVIVTAPVAGGASEYRCTTGGAPGVWKALTLAV